MVLIFLLTNYESAVIYKEINHRKHRVKRETQRDGSRGFVF